MMSGARRRKADRFINDQVPVLLLLGRQLQRDDDEDPRGRDVCVGSTFGADDALAFRVAQVAVAHLTSRGCAL